MLHPGVGLTGNEMMTPEPNNLLRWRTGTPGKVFTCGRPGRATHGPKIPAVNDEVLSQWVAGLPHYPVLHIVSLLGRKPSGQSEFAPYPFRSEYEASDKDTFQQWLAQRYPRRFVVHEYPTEDFKPVLQSTLTQLTQLIGPLLLAEQTIVLVDSAGCSRTNEVCRKLGWKPCPARRMA
jgi:hypothetical protein